MASNAEEVKSSIKIYLFVFGALAVLTIVTVAAKELKIGVAAGIAVALLIASVKGTLVASYFMHLIHERATLYWIIGLCALFFLMMVMIPVLQQSETAHLITPVYQAVGDEPLDFGPEQPVHAGHGVDGHSEDGHDEAGHGDAEHDHGDHDGHDHGAHGEDAGH